MRVVWLEMIATQLGKGSGQVAASPLQRAPASRSLKTQPHEA